MARVSKVYRNLWWVLLKIHTVMKNIRGYVEYIRESESIDELIDLSTAIYLGDVKTTKRLIDAGVNVNADPRDSDTQFPPLHWAVIRNKGDIVKLLVHAGAKLDSRLSGGWSIMHTAVVYSNIDIIKFLIDAGADIDALDDYKWTPFYWAIFKKRPDAAKLLIQSGAEINLKTQFGTFKEFNDFFGGDVKWIPGDLIPPEWRESAKFTGTFGGFY
jgi:ankyrin repeat protein